VERIPGTPTPRLDDGASPRTTTLGAVEPDERAVLGRAIQRVTEQAAAADAIVDDGMEAGLDGSDRIVVSTNMVRAELLSVKSDLEREPERVVLDCVVCGRTVHYVGGLGVQAGHWAHREPEPHATPKLAR
jgi:hypothetical protein